jgi:hypothetical protein
MSPGLRDDDADDGTSRGDGRPSQVQQDHAVGHAEADGAALNIPTAALNLPEKKEDTSDRTFPDDGQTQRPPVPLANLNLSFIDDHRRV